MTLRIYGPIKKFHEYGVAAKLINCIMNVKVIITKIKYNFGKKWASRRNILDASATLSGIKHKWYVYKVSKYIYALYFR
jgi:hypothetical protein